MMTLIMMNVCACFVLDIIGTMSSPVLTQNRKRKLLSKLFWRWHPFSILSSTLLSRYKVWNVLLIITWRRRPWASMIFWSWPLINYNYFWILMLNEHFFLHYGLHNKRGSLFQCDQIYITYWLLIIPSLHIMSGLFFRLWLYFGRWWLICCTSLKHIFFNKTCTTTRWSMSNLLYHFLFAQWNMSCTRILIKSTAAGRTSHIIRVWIQVCRWLLCWKSCWRVWFGLFGIWSGYWLIRLRLSCLSNHLYECFVFWTPVSFLGCCLFHKT